MAGNSATEQRSQWKVDVNAHRYTLAEVAQHKTKEDLWVIIHDQVFDVTKYLAEHPGGADPFLEYAGGDATDAYEDVGHSEDAREVMMGYFKGVCPSENKAVSMPKVVKVNRSLPPSLPTEHPPNHAKAGLVILGTAVLLYQPLVLLSKKSAAVVPGNHVLHLETGGFAKGFVASAALFAAAGSILTKYASKFLDVTSSRAFTKYPEHIKATKTKIYPTLTPKGVLDPLNYTKFPLISRDNLSPSVVKFVFALPEASSVLGLPIGQHVAIRAHVGDQIVTRSYTPVSNNRDRGRLELVIKIYNDGLLTGGFLGNIRVGDQVEFRGPKGAMRYRKSLAKQIGMVAGGTGITPMYQLIRAICEDKSDTTEVSLVYANPTEGDILLRTQLEGFAAEAPHKLKIWYMLDKPGPSWKYGTGFVDRKVLEERMPAPGPGSKIMLCGPPGMIKGTTKNLVAMGFKAPGTVSHMTDEIFLF